MTATGIDDQTLGRSTQAGLARGMVQSDFAGCARCSRRSSATPGTPGTRASTGTPRVVSNDQAAVVVTQSEAQPSGQVFIATTAGCLPSTRGGPLVKAPTKKARRNGPVLGGCRAQATMRIGGSSATCFSSALFAFSCSASKISLRAFGTNRVITSRMSG